MAAYYNEWDKDAAEWIRQLIKLGVIPEGEVDERSISDVAPSDLMGFTQCHFFAGIGAWAYALRQAGWPDDRPAWTGSCPCQSFSNAGKRKGFDDERHLWPDWFWLIEVGRPVCIFGEQVSSKDALAWLDLVSADLEGIGYSAGALAPCSAGVGAPCIRERLYWVASSCGERVLRAVGSHSGKTRADMQNGEEWERLRPDVGASLRTGGLVQPDRDGRWTDLEGSGPQGRTAAGRPGADGGLASAGSVGPRGCGDGDSGRLIGEVQAEGRSAAVRFASPEVERPQEVQPYKRLPAERDHRPGPTNGFWAGADWALCRDERKGVLRPTLRPFESEPEPFALADGVAESLGFGWQAGEASTFPLSVKEVDRAMRLKGYGNAINAEVARLFIESAMEAL